MDRRGKRLVMKEGFTQHSALFEGSRGVGREDSSRKMSVQGRGIISFPDCPNRKLGIIDSVGLLLSGCSFGRGVGM